MKAHGLPGTPGALAWVHVTVMQKEIEQEASQMVPLHAQAIQLRWEVVQVPQLNKLNNEAKKENLFNLKLKVYGQHGILGALVLVLVIVMLNGTEQGTSQVVTYLVLEVQLKKEIVQVLI